MKIQEHAKLGAIQDRYHFDIVQLVYSDLRPAQSYDDIYVACPERDVDVLAASISMIHAAKESEVRLVMGSRCFLIVEHPSVPHTYVGVEYAKGTPLVKSLKRILMRTFRHFGPPVPEERRPRAVAGEVVSEEISPPEAVE